MSSRGCLHWSSKLNVSWRATLIASHFLSFFLFTLFREVSHTLLRCTCQGSGIYWLMINCKFLACSEINTFSKSGRRRGISLNYFKRSTLRFENEVNLFSYQSEEQFYIPNRDTNTKGRIIIGEENEIGMNGSPLDPSRENSYRNETDKLINRSNTPLI